MLAVRVSRARRARHRKFRGATRGGGRPRLERFDSWLDARQTVLGATGTAATISGVDAPNDELDFAGAHPFADFNVVRVTSTLTLPAGITALTDYFVDDAAALAIGLADTFGMRRDSQRVDITDAGTGVIDVTPAAEKSSLIGWLRSRKPIQIQDATDIDNL